MALFLIFVLLYFAFRSLRDTLIIFSAIPLAAVGGVLLLWIRDMPFSISAGVGFIALFGIAVLNGIVMIEHIKDLKRDAFKDRESMIVQGAQDRMRAVLLTASAAALGFLPMAVSTSAGAEVQRPLATVVIGGLITATLLTLIVLPVLYAMFSQGGKEKRGQNAGSQKVLLAALFLLPAFGLRAQAPPLGLEELLALVEKQNPGLQAAQKSWEAAEARRGTAYDFGKSEFYYNRDEANRINDLALNVLGVQQELEFPTVYAARRKVQNYLALSEKNQYDIRKKDLFRELSNLYSQYLISTEKIRIYQRLDSLYSAFARAASRRFELGATNYLEKATALSKSRQLHLRLQETRTEARALKGLILSLAGEDSTRTLDAPAPYRMMTTVPDMENLPELARYENRGLALEKQYRLEQQGLLPDLTLAYFQGTNGLTDQALIGYQLGLRIPLFFNGQAARIRAARLQAAAFTDERQEYERRLRARIGRLLTEREQQERALLYYEEEGLVLSETLLRTAERSFSNGEIDFFQYIQSLENGYEISLDYLDQLRRYNEIILQITYLTL